MAAADGFRPFKLLHACRRDPRVSKMESAGMFMAAIHDVTEADNKKEWEAKQSSSSSASEAAYTPTEFKVHVFASSKRASENMFEKVRRDLSKLPNNPTRVQTPLLLMPPPEHLLLKAPVNQQEEKEKDKKECEPATIACPPPGVLYSSHSDGYLATCQKLLDDFKFTRLSSDQLQAHYLMMAAAAPMIYGSDHPPMHRLLNDFGAHNFHSMSMSMQLGHPSSARSSSRSSSTVPVTNVTADDATDTTGPDDC